MFCARHVPSPLQIMTHMLSLSILDVMALLFFCHVLKYLAHLLGIILTSIENKNLLPSLGL